MGDGSTEIESNCPDVTGYSLDDVVTIRNPVLDNAIRRLWDEASRAEEIRAGFSSSIDTTDTSGGHTGWKRNGRSIPSTSPN
jgi:FXSXX-COOH protein